MASIFRKIKENYLFGCIKYKENYTFYLMPLAFWILNYEKYDPDYRPDDWSSVFRDDVLNVSDENISKFLDAIEIDKLDIEELIVAFQINRSDHFQLNFFIDFDNRLFINGFPEIDIEEYLPNSSWKGKYDNPTDYLPKELKMYFS